jgi:hypothetical protein
MRNRFPLVRSGRCGSDIHTAIRLHGIRPDDFTIHDFRDCDS